MPNIFGYIRESISEGDGLRSVIFLSGCDAHCKGCHNPESWNRDFGVEFTEELQEKIINEMVVNPLLDGVTFCGGEPFLFSKFLSSFIERLKEKRPDLNYWSYSGFTFEELSQSDEQRELLEHLNVLIDGKFIEELKDLTLRFRGSKNQRIIDVQKSLEANKAIPYKEGENL